MAETATSIVGLTIADVKQAMGLLSATTTYDEYISEVIQSKADLYLEDVLTVSELRDLTVDQKRRAVIGVSMLIAADCLLVLPTNSLMGDGGGESMSLGPISIGAWNGARGVSDMRQMAAQLRNRGESILDDLRLLNQRGHIPWGAVGTTKNPTYTGGPRIGIPRTFYGYR